MVEYSKQEQVQIDELFEEFEHHGIQYVVPRGYQDLPESVPGGDVDILVSPDSYSEAIDISKQIGFENANTRVTNFLELVKRGLVKPRHTALLLLTDFQSVLETVSNNIKPHEEKNDHIASEYSEYKAEYENVIVHLMNHVVYTSPHNGRKVRADPEIERKLYTRSTVRNGVSVPSPPDELAHLICRGVFDHEGSFPEYYINWCDNLAETVLTNKEYSENFEELLELLFFNAASKVYKNIEESTYDSIKTDLIQFDDY